MTGLPVFWFALWKISFWFEGLLAGVEFLSWLNIYPFLLALNFCSAFTSWIPKRTHKKWVKFDEPAMSRPLVAAHVVLNKTNKTNRSQKKLNENPVWVSNEVCLAKLGPTSLIWFSIYFCSSSLSEGCVSDVGSPGFILVELICWIKSWSLIPILLFKDPFRGQ